MKKLCSILMFAGCSALYASLETMLEFNALAATAEYCRRIKKDALENKEELSPEKVQMCEINDKKYNEFVIARYASTIKKPRSRMRS